ncbi:MAG: lipopolysaccharide assembly protein LapA domain-containing protein [Alphaproteobacteria bacterium]|nr:lipopolysaccharide assembly protein LapA domain-containing protein [Alphaproteobacteria bacterium]
MKLLQFLFSTLLITITVLFAVSNRQVVTMTLWPLPFEFEMSFSFIIIAFALLFFVLGGMYAWVLALPVKAAKIKQDYTIKNLTKKLEATKTEQ